MRDYKVFKKWDKAILDKHKKVMNSPKGYHRITSDKSGDLKPICLGISSPETIWRPCNLTLKTRIANGMMPLS